MRSAAVSFLDRGPWASAAITPIAGDLSARSYFRLSKAGRTAILMDAAGEETSTSHFVKMTMWLRELGLSAPEIFVEERQNGFLVLEDLGDTAVSQVMDDHIIDECLSLLTTIRAAPPPSLSQPTPSEMVDWTALIDDYYPGIEKSALRAFRRKLETVLQEISGSVSVSLRDFHADNLMWLPDRTGIARLGLLDYQDAFLCHPVYDLVSLLTDARTEISSGVRRAGMESYLARSGDDPDTWKLAFAAYSAQRNLRILGVFMRAAQDHGKSHHLPKVPRVLGYIAEALEHPVFSEMREDVLRALPVPKVQA